MKAIILIVFLVHSSLVLTRGSAQTSIGGADSLLLAQRAVSELQDEVSAFDMSLVEPLNSLVDQLMADGQLELAHRTIDRAMQIIRINEGLYTNAQFPLLHKKIDNLANQGNWDDARTQLDHLVFLYTKKQKFASQELLNGFARLAAVHLRGISDDSYEYQGLHFSRVSAASWIALAIGEGLWGKEDPRLVPLIYAVLSQFHLEYVAINTSGRTGVEIRTVAPESNWVREVSEMRRYYLLAGAELLSQVKAIYSAEAQYDQEAMAMADLYLADWLSLFNQSESALAAYSEAYESLLASKVDAQALDRFFATPRLLPEAQFYPSLTEAIEAHESGIGPDMVEVELGSDSQVQLLFAEWSPGFPFAQQPSRLGGARMSSDALAIFSFKLGGFPDVERLLKGRRPIGLGTIENLTALTELPESDYQKRQLLNRVSSLRFRPKLVEGLPHETNATLVYVLATPY